MSYLTHLGWSALSKRTCCPPTLKADEKERLTLEAMLRGDALIYGGRISADDLIGIPDLLRKEVGGYIPGDIKSGAGEEAGGEDGDGKPKLHYAVQLAAARPFSRPARVRLGHQRRGSTLRLLGRASINLGAAWGNQKCEGPAD